jgi:membrane-bound lytic murein transglycosylase F
MTNYKIILLIAVVFFTLGWQTSTIFSDKSTLSKTKLTTLEKIKQKKQLDVIILNSPTVYYIGANKKLGFEYELISAYAKYLGVKLNLKVVYTVSEALQLSKKNIADITVASISITPEREKIFKFGPQYYSVQEQLVCTNNIKEKSFPKNLQDMSEFNIVVGKDTSYEETLKKISSEIDGFSFKTTTQYSSEQLLSQVNDKKIDCTVVDSNIFMINQRYYPEIKRSLILSERKYLGWILRDPDNSLNENLYKWLNSYERSGKIAELRDYYYSFLSIFDYYDTKVFSKRLKTRLPKYKKYFIDASKKFDVPWKLLAAQAYQESHWNPKAKSHTGVRGMMMITRATAKQLGVKNRLNAKDSIYGGAKYLKKLQSRFSDKIQGKNRWLFTLAAYNIGMGHMHDAQTLARKLNKNPYSWKDIKSVLPLLTQKKYYKKLKFGYARGNEPVKYVNAIQNYLNILIQEENSKNSPKAQQR